MAQTLDIKLSNYTASYREIVNMGWHVAEATNAVLKEFAGDIKRQSRTELQNARTPSNLFRNVTGAPKYTYRRKSAFYYKVSTPTGVWGRPAALYEYAEHNHGKQGKALIAAMNGRKGAPNRIMYGVHDRLLPQYKQKHADAIRRVEEEANQVTG